MPIYLLHNLRDIILSLAALAIALSALWRLWGKPVQRWFVEQAERREQRLVNIETVLEREFANGVPPLLHDGTANPEYVPLRKAFDAHLAWSREQVDRFDEHVRGHP